MIQTCEICGKNWCGLVLDPAQPPSKTCPWCGATEEQQIKAIIERAQQVVAKIAKQERDGEHVTAETMNFICYGE